MPLVVDDDHTRRIVPIGSRQLSAVIFRLSYVVDGESSRDFIIFNFSPLDARVADGRHSFGSAVTVPCRVRLAFFLSV